MANKSRRKTFGFTVTFGARLGHAYTGEEVSDPAVLARLDGIGRP
jgi:hypothetical protein